MKKIIALIIAVLMLVSLVACGNTNDAQLDGTNNSNTTDTNASNSADESENNGTADVADAKAAKEILDGALVKFSEVLAPAFDMPAEDIKSFFVGGYFSEDETTMAMGESGKHPLNVEESVEMLKSISLITDAELAKIDDAATLYHGMNTNNFSASSLRVANAGDVEAFANTMKELDSNNQWVCGFPEKYVIITIDTCVISAYGNTDMVNAVKTAVTEIYENAVVVCDEAFA